MLFCSSIGRALPETSLCRRLRLWSLADTRTYMQSIVPKRELGNIAASATRWTTQQGRRSTKWQSSSH